MCVCVCVRVCAMGPHQNTSIITVDAPFCFPAVGAKNVLGYERIRACICVLRWAHVLCTWSRVSLQVQRPPPKQPTPSSICMLSTCITCYRCGLQHAQCLGLERDCTLLLVARVQVCRPTPSVHGSTVEGLQGAVVLAVATHHVRNGSGQVAELGRGDGAW